MFTGKEKKPCTSEENDQNNSKEKVLNHRNTTVFIMVSVMDLVTDSQDNWPLLFALQPKNQVNVAIKFNGVGVCCRLSPTELVITKCYIKARQHVFTIGRSTLGYVYT